ncbi:MAG: helix-turn-helix domain-containing protein [Pseudomonadota bacterium]
MYILYCMVRTRQFDPATALQTAVELFSAKGYAETSMDDLVKATGVSRYGIYGTFGNKRELFEKALDVYADRMGRRAFERLAEPGARLADIEAIFADRVADMCDKHESKACLFIHTAMELAPQDDDLREVLRRFMVGMAKAFACGLKSAQQAGEVRADLDRRAAGEELTSTMFGLSVLARVGFSRASLDRIVDVTLASLRS